MELNYDIKIHTSAWSRLEAGAYTNDLVFLNGYSNLEPELNIL